MLSKINTKNVIFLVVKSNKMSPTIPGGPRGPVGPWGPMGPSISFPPSVSYKEHENTTNYITMIHSYHIFRKS